MIAPPGKFAQTSQSCFLLLNQNEMFCLKMMMESSIKTWSHKTGSQCSEKYRMIDQSSQMFYAQVHPAVLLKNIQIQIHTNTNMYKYIYIIQIQI